MKKREMVEEEQGGFKYRLRRTGCSSEWYGPCEVCGKQADTVYYQVKMEPIKNGTKWGFGSSKYGHKECLLEWRNV